AGTLGGEAPSHQGEVKFRRLKYASGSANARGDFIDSLRRTRSAGQLQFRKAAEVIAGRLGLHATHTVDALHDGPRGATPGVAQALYAGRPEDVEAAANWYGLVGNAPGVATFHVRPGGPDRLYRFRQGGSGLDIRYKLDRHGLTDRVLIPHEK